MEGSYENRSLESLEQEESYFHYLVAAFSALMPVLKIDALVTLDADKLIFMRSDVRSS